METKIRLLPLREAQTKAFKEEMQEAFQHSFLYVKVGVQSKGIGQAIWKAIEVLHPETEVWETCTPYFDRRNIHFYINRLGFHAVEFFNEHHPDPHMPEQLTEQREPSCLHEWPSREGRRRSQMGTNGIRGACCRRYVR